MKNIILDTCVFVSENFLHSRKINSLIKLSSNGRINLYITQITYNEILKKFNEFSFESLTLYKKFKKDARYLRNNDRLKILFQEIKKEEVFNDFKTRLDDLVKTGELKIIPYGVLDISNVFDNYFNSQPPFGIGNKKHEFPDAFTSELIEKYIDEKKLTDIVIFSLDNDFSNLNSKATISKDYETFLNDEYSNIEKAKIAEQVVISNEVKIRNEFKEWYKTNLDDMSLYYQAVNWKDVYDISIKSIQVGDLQHSIIEIDKDTVVIEITAEVIVEVDILTDDEEYQYYDSDDRSYHYLETTTETYKKEFDSSMIIYVEVENAENYSDDIEIEVINENVRIDFNISDEHYY
ncbi:PIN domain-containing protein [Chryseobacterium soli]|uniref:PIN domain-containing protein n=1 Tax=Chryseobacterium soli TaxID=445961 RepID=UPI000A6799AB|nr:PIN domain-containing protein [Chryseobacterium soli]